MVSNKQSSAIILILSIVALVLLVQSNSVNIQDDKYTSNNNPVIYLVPHQDDETLSMSIDIINNINRGKEIILVLYTSGVGSTALEQLNGDRYSYYWNCHHEPRNEGYERLTNIEFAKARTNEFRGACGQLGVKQENIFIHPFKKPTKEDLEQLIMNFKNVYPNAAFRAMSFWDSHKQHAIGGEALKGLIEERKVEGMFFFSRYDFNKLHNWGRFISTDTNGVKRLYRAVDCYKAWNPFAKSFAIGYHSVKNQFDNLLKIPLNRIHYINK